MGRPLDVKELLLLKSKASDIKILQPHKKSNINKPKTHKDVPKAKDDEQDIDDIILNLQTSKKVDKLSKIPKRTKAFREEVSFETKLKNKPLDQMTKTCWDMYAKMNRIEMNTLTNDKRYHPVRSLDGYDHLKLDPMAQYTLKDLTQEKSKGLVCVGNSGVLKTEILSIVLPVVLHLKQTPEIKSTEKTPVCCVVVNDDEQKEDILTKLDHLSKAKFPETRNLKECFYVNTIDKFKNDINTNFINYHVNLKWLVFDYLDLNKLVEIDNILMNIKNRNIQRVFYIRRQYNLSLPNKSEETFDERLEKLIDAIKPGNTSTDDGYKFKSKMFNDVNILIIR